MKVPFQLTLVGKFWVKRSAGPSGIARHKRRWWSKWTQRTSGIHRVYRTNWTAGKAGKFKLSIT